jgi:hypothetical protein
MGIECASVGLGDMQICSGPRESFLVVKIIILPEGPPRQCVSFDDR